MALVPASRAMLRPAVGRARAAAAGYCGCWVPPRSQQERCARQRHGCAPAAAAASAGQQSSPSSPQPTLNWTVGVVLATLSFEAYNELSKKGIPECLQDGTSIFYVDRAFLREKLAGLLQLAYKASSNIPAAEDTSWIALKECRLTFSVGNSICECTPQEDTSCNMFVRDIQRQWLTVRVMESERWSTGEQHLGSAVHDLQGICDGQQHELALELRGGSAANSSNGRATVHLTCRFLPFSDVLAQDAANFEMGGSVVGTPGQIPLAADWQELLELAGIAPNVLTPIAFVEDSATNTQAWVYWNRVERMACVAFRGTEQGKWQDILTDLHLVPAPLDPESVAAAPRNAALAEVSQSPDEPGRLRQILSAVEQAKQRQGKEGQEEEPDHIVAAAMSAVRSTAQELTAVLAHVQQELEAGAETADTDQPWVHSGFLTAYDGVRPAILSLLADMLHGEDGQWRLYLTGHSLGGALATLCAWDASHRRWPCEVDLVVYSFGSPRVGNRAFALDYNRRLPHTWRIVNANDTVSTIPRLMGYAHVGHAVHLRDGQVEVEMNSTEKLGEGIFLPDVAPAVGGVLQATVAAKVPELLPTAVTEVLTNVGIEIASTGNEEVAAAAAASVGGSSGSGGSMDSPPAEAGVTPERLSEFWQQELDAWSMLLDGSSLDNHMEPLYLQNLRSYLQAVAEEGSTRGNHSSHGNDSAAGQPIKTATTQEGLAGDQQRQSD